MITTNEQKLNRMLADWRELREYRLILPSPVHIHGQIIFTCEETGFNNYWSDPFTYSLDALFKWIVPKAIKEFGAMPVYFAACNAMYESIYKKSFSTKKAPYDGKPALIFCKEIKELIDKQLPEQTKERCKYWIEYHPDMGCIPALGECKTCKRFAKK